MPDWSPDPNQDIANIAAALQANDTYSVTVYGTTGWLQQAADFIRSVPWQLNITWFIPVGEIPVGLGPAFTAAYNPSSHTGCVGGGVGAGTLGKSFNVGPLMHGNVGNADSILSGPSLSGGAQPTPVIGYQATGNSSGALGGPSVGTPGMSVSATYSKCRKVY
jgi:hypothetical protein